jgi:chromosome segregation ATPase
MLPEPQTHDDFTQRRLERLELRYRRARFVLAGAQTAYKSLRATPGAGELRLRQALQRVEQAQELVVDIQSAIEYLEDQERVARFSRSPVRPRL